MRRRAVWIGVLAVLAASLVAAPAASAQIKLGVKGGVNIADLGGSDAASLGTLKTKAGFIAGGFAEFMIGTMFAIQPEVLYTQKGVKATEQGVEFKFKVDYIEVPVLVKLNIPIEGSKVDPSVYVGPSVAFRSSCKIAGSGGGASAEIDCDAGGVDPFKSTDFGLAFGGGVGFDVGGAEVGVEVRYTLGLQTIDDTGSSADVKNQVISIMGSVGFPLNR